MRKMASSVTVRMGCVIACLCALLGASAGAVDRNAFTFVRYELEARVMPGEQAMAVRGKITLRNDSKEPQRQVALQISSSMVWDTIESSGEDLQWVSSAYTTDIDHTGAVTEAIATLPKAVAPQGTVELDVVYGGAVTADATRLTRIGAPTVAGARTEWDQIGQEFSGVRGLGYVCWYPVAIEAVSLSDGTAVFRALSAWKERHVASNLKLKLAVESEGTIVSNGRLTGQRARVEEDGPVQERDLEFASLGQTVPTFAVAGYALLDRPAINIFYLPGQQAHAQDFVLAAEKLLPVVSDRFGSPKEKVSVVELPAGKAPFDSGTMLFAPLGASRDAIEVAVAHHLTHAAVTSDRLWISEGLAHFAQALVVERQHGRRQALVYLQLSQAAQAAAEEQTLRKGEPEPEPLIRTGDQLFYRSKAMFVWWMLRDMVGDAALGRALRAYRAADDREPSYVQRLIEKESGKKLEWFFDDWVYRDRGLPDFRITAAFARQMLPSNYTITVTVENRGEAAAEVPVLVPVGDRETQERLLVPAHGSAVARINAPSAPAEVVVNDGSVPEANATNNRYSLPKPAEPARP